MNVQERFLHYVSFDTQSDEHSQTTPSSLKQLKLAEALVDEMKAIGIEDAYVDEFGIVYGTIPATTKKDVKSIGFIAHMAVSYTHLLDDYRIVKDHLFGNKQRTTKNRGQIAYSVFISPTFSRVGLSEQEAREQGYAVKTVSMPAAAIPRANVISQPDGLLKAVIDTKTDQILGCVLFCAESEEVINFVQLAMNQRLTYQEVGNHIFTHPVSYTHLDVYKRQVCS